MGGFTSSKINQKTAQQIINEFCEGASSYELADKYDLWQTSICNLISGRTWANCQRPENIKEIIKQRHIKGMFKKGMKCHIDAPPLTDFQMDVVIGSLLGDGFIKLGTANCSFGKNQCKKYKQYIGWHNEVLQPYSSKILDGYSNERLVGGNKGVITKRVKVDRYLTDY